MTENSKSAGPVRETAPAKINLTLQVRRRRDDGFHEIDSLVAFADFGDELEVVQAPGFSLEIEGPFSAALAGEADNLVAQAARAFAAAGQREPEFSVRLEKHIPVAAGLGGGSADAAAMLRAALRLCADKPSAVALTQMAAALGADVPGCLNPSAQWMSGIGHDLAPAPALPPVAVVLVNPGIEIATPEVFEGLGIDPGCEAAGSGGMPRPERFLDTADFIGYLREGRNDLEVPAGRLAHEIGDVQDALFAQAGCLLARMSGSGPTCFGLFEQPGEASEAAAQISATWPAWWVRACSLL